jgi:inner membrane protein
MATIFTHALVAVAACKIIEAKPSKKLLGVAALSSVVPDFDVVGLAMGIPYAAPLGHRGFTHSVLFAFIWAGFMCLMFPKGQRLKISLLLFAITLSHGLLDALTDGGHGVGFLIPFDNTRMFAPRQYRVLAVSPIGYGFFSMEGLKVLGSELLWVWLPCLILYVPFMLYRIISPKKSIKE